MTDKTTRQRSISGVSVEPHVASAWPPVMVIVEFAAYGVHEMGVTSWPGKVRDEHRLEQLIVAAVVAPVDVAVAVAEAVGELLGVETVTPIEGSDVPLEVDDIEGVWLDVAVACSVVPEALSIDVVADDEMLAANERLEEAESRLESNVAIDEEAASVLKELVVAKEGTDVVGPGWPGDEGEVGEGLLATPGGSWPL